MDLVDLDLTPKVLEKLYLAYLVPNSNQKQISQQISKALEPGNQDM